MATTKTAKTTKKKSSATKTKPTEHMRSLRRSPEQSPFFLFRITQQSVYWLILCLLILALGVWVVTLSVKVQSLYDQVDDNTTQSQSSTDTKNY